MKRPARPLGLEKKNLKASMMKRAGVLAACLALPGVGCVGVFNSAFLNTLIGGQFPLTPGPVSAFVFVRCVNETNQAAEFIVSIERDVLAVDDAGNPQIDEDGNFITRPERETVRLQTGATGRARELGTVFACGESPVTIVGLGESLSSDDVAVFVGGGGAGGAEGAGIRVGNLNPLLLEEGNFNCGDTIIFNAFQSFGVPGGVGLRAFLLPGSEQPSLFAGPSTFQNLEAFLESQVREEAP